MKANEKRDTVNATNNVVKYYKSPFIGHIQQMSNIRLIDFVNIIVKFKYEDCFNSI